MFVWPPIPLQPLDDGPDRKFAHSDRLALAMTIAPAALISLDDEGVVGRAARERPRAGRIRHAGRVDVVLDDDRDAEQRSVVAAAPRRSAARASARAVGLTLMTALSVGFSFLMRFR